jgi:hypothetical protein
MARGSEQSSNLFVRAPGLEGVNGASGYVASKWARDPGSRRAAERFELGDTGDPRQYSVHSRNARFDR